MLLKVEDLFVDIVKDNNVFEVITQVSFSLKEKEILCIVGESGCGKTVLGLSILRLLPSYFKVRGKILFKEKDILSLRPKELEDIRGKEISMVFQDPMISLNPLFKIGDQIKEVLDVHNIFDPEERKKRVIELLAEVGLPANYEFYNRYPHQLSGGQKQRVMIAMAVACNPYLLIADEPTTALDVTVQAQIVQLFKKIKDSHKSSIIYITHDLNIVKHIGDRVSIMYLGCIVEEGFVEDIFKKAFHPYTKGLLEAIPSIYKKNRPLKSISGTVPSLDNRPKGCVFHTRCPKSFKKCEEAFPRLKEIEKSHFVRCFLYE